MTVHIRAQELSRRQEVQRGRRFMHVYASPLLLALAAFICLAFLVHGQDRLLRLDQEIAETIQGIHLPLYAWVLTHTSNLAFAPLNLVAYAAIGAAFLATGLRLEATLAVASPALASLVGVVLKHVVLLSKPGWEASGLPGRRTEASSRLPHESTIDAYTRLVCRGRSDASGGDNIV